MKDYYFEIPFFFSDVKGTGFAYWKEKHKEAEALENIVKDKFFEVWKNYSKYPSLWYELVSNSKEEYRWEIYKKKDIDRKIFSETFYKGNVIATITIKVLANKK